MLGAAWFDREKCGQGLQSLWAYQREWDDVRSCFKPRPLHDWTSHAADAMRYAAVGFRRPETLGGRGTARTTYDLMEW